MPLAQQLCNIIFAYKLILSSNRVLQNVRFPPRRHRFYVFPLHNKYFPLTMDGSDGN